MSFEDPARAPRGRRRHASARRGRGAVWLVAVGGAAVLGLGAVALTGGGGAKRPAERGAERGGLPALIQTGPKASGTTQAPAPSRGTSGPAGLAPSTARPSAPASATPSATTAPATETAPTATPTPTATGKPGRGRGNGKGPR